MRSIVVDKRDRPAPPVAQKKKTAKANARKRKAPQARRAKMIPDMMTSFLKLRLWKAGTKSPGRAKARGKQRRKPKPLWFKPVLYVSAAVMALAPLGYFGYQALEMELPEKASQWASDEFDKAATTLGLSVQDITVRGRERTGRRALMQALGVTRGDNIFRFDPMDAKARLESLGWVETAMVKRNLPDQIFIDVTERRPFVRWQNKGEVVLVDRRGFVITSSKDDQSEFAYLPKVVGAGANIKAAGLFDLMSATPALFTRVRNAVRIRDRRWNIEFENDVTVLLPQEGVAAAWQKLTGLQSKDNILGKDLVSIDLRSKDKIYVRLSPGAAAAAAARRKQGRET